MGDAMNQTEKTDRPTTYYMRRLHRWRMAFFGLVILMAGFVIGAASITILAPNRLTRPPQPAEKATRMMTERLRRELGLSPEQDEKIGPILQEHLQKLEEIRTNARTEITEQLQQMDEGVSAVLTEEQKQIWQRWLRMLQWQLRPSGRGPGEGGRHRGGPQERMRRGPGPFGPGRRPDGPNMPHNGMRRGMMPRRYEKSTNEDL
jgi:Spy/CpxP family protein refolding chaperone